MFRLFYVQSPWRGHGAENGDFPLRQTTESIRQRPTRSQIHIAGNFVVASSSRRWQEVVVSALKCLLHSWAGSRLQRPAPLRQPQTTLSYHQDSFFLSRSQGCATDVRTGINPQQPQQLLGTPHLHDNLRANLEGTEDKPTEGEVGIIITTIIVINLVLKLLATFDKVFLL